MNRIIIFFLALSISIAETTAQLDFNIELISNTDYEQNCNDIWAWTSNDGISYAILGTVTGTAILDISDLSNPKEVQFISGTNSTWRDMKSWGDFVYVTTDVGKDGLLIIDMSGAPDSITWEYWQPELETNGPIDTLHKCHNIYIDENGYAYLAGCNLNGGGPLIFDVHTTPGKPIYQSATDPRYSHDVYTRNNLMYSSDINNGFFSIVDVSDKLNPLTIATQQTSFRFTHNAWLSDDGNILFTTDERANAFVEAYDVSDPENITFLDAYRPLATLGQGVIPHNVHVKDDYLVISYYTDGIKIVDASDPTNLVEVGAYDTYPQQAGGFNGCWGAYPWLPSGDLLASDINTGLYILKPNYVRAARIDGQVTDLETGQQLGGVTVMIDSEQAAFTTTNNAGLYKTGLGIAGSYTVTFSQPGYISQEVEVDFVNGETKTINVQLQPLERFVFDISVINKITGEPIGFPKVTIENEVINDTSEGDEFGHIQIEGFESDYELIIGAWGYNYQVINENLNQNISITVELEPGIVDDFVFDYGWTVDGNTEIGQWERGIPEATFLEGLPSNPGSAFPNALGGKCYVTGAEAGPNVGAFDLDDGFTFLRSPMIDLSQYENPELQYARWFVNGGGFTPTDDTLIVYLITNEEEIILEKVWGSTNRWTLSPTFNLKDLVNLDEPVQIVFEASDLPGTGHIVEAAIDFFSIQDNIQTSISEEPTISQELKVYPNPTSGESFYLEMKGIEDRVGLNAMLKITSLNGQTVYFENRRIDNTIIQVNSSHKLNEGMYFVEIILEDGKTYLGRLMVITK